MTLTMGSLFAGIGGFDEGFRRAGIETRWMVEWDKHCQTVLRHRFPGVPIHGDITTVDPVDLAPVDVITAGVPCQDVSVAGKRAGLAGARTGLFWESVRILEVMQPPFFVLENVPGLLSSNGGDDIITVMDALESLGYICDLDIIDAQYFGVAQRRRRVFIVCQHVEHLIQQRTNSSALTIAQCLIEILGGLLIAHSTQSSIARSISVCGSGISVDGLHRRMTLFGLHRDDRLLMLQQSLDAASARCPAVTGNSASAHGGSERCTRRCGGISSRTTCGETARQYGECFTAPSWKRILDDLCSEVKSFTTSTGTSTTTDLRIYTCALMSERIAWLIYQLNDYSPTYWSAASSALTVIEGFTSYARQSGISLFTPMDRVQSWADFARRSADLCFALRDSRIRSWGQVQPLSESLSGHPAPRRETGARLATDVAASLKSRGEGTGTRIDAETGIVAIQDGSMPRAKKQNGIGITPGGPMYTLDGHGAHAVAAPRAARQAKGPFTDPANDNIVAVDLAQVTSKGNYSNPKPGDPCHPLTSAANQSVVAFNWQTGGSKPRYGFSEHGVDALQLKQTPAVQQASTVRRLTPREAERLQGFPDDWSLVDGMSDSARYRMLGNAVTVNVAEYLARRIAREITSQPT